MLNERKNPNLSCSGLSRRSFAFQLDGFDASQVAALDVDLPRNLEGVSQKRIVEYTLGRYAATSACRDLGVAGPIVIGTAPSRAPVWPRGLVGAITHTEGFVSAAIARADEVRSIGLDAERVMSPETLDEVRDLVAVPAEQERARLWGLADRELYSLIFSAKESIYKCLNPLTGVFFDFHDAEIYRLDRERRLFFFRLRRDLGAGFAPGFRHFGSYSIEDGLVHTSVVLYREPDHDRSQS